MTDVHKLIDALERASRGETIPNVTRPELMAEAAFLLRAQERDLQQYRLLTEDQARAAL